MTSLAWVVAGVAEAMLLWAAVHRGWWDWGRAVRLACRIPGSPPEDNRFLFIHLGALMGAVLLHDWLGRVAIPFVVAAFAGILWSLIFLTSSRDRRNDFPSMPNAIGQGGAPDELGPDDRRHDHMGVGRATSAHDSAS